MDPAPPHPSDEPVHAPAPARPRRRRRRRPAERLRGGPAQRRGRQEGPPKDRSGAHQRKDREGRRQAVPARSVQARRKYSFVLCSLMGNKLSALNFRALGAVNVTSSGEIRLDCDTEQGGEFVAKKTADGFFCASDRSRWCCCSVGWWSRDRGSCLGCWGIFSALCNSCCCFYSGPD